MILSIKYTVRYPLLHLKQTVLWGDCKVRRNIVYEVMYSIHSFKTRCIGTEFYQVPSHFGFCWNEISDKSAKLGAMKNMSKISHTTYCYRLMRLLQYLERQCIKIIKRKEKRRIKSAIPSCSRYGLNSWNTKQSQTVTCICKNYCPI